MGVSYSHVDILKECKIKVRGLLARRRLREENAFLRQAVERQNAEWEVVARSPAMKEVMRWASQAATVKEPVLLTGEMGTGKETIARAIHRLGNHGDGPFVAVNIASVPELRLEGELFGYQWVTAGDQQREGTLRSAGNGTVFLDNVASLSPTVQTKLLEVLDTKMVVPSGGGEAVPLQARIIAATHRDLGRMSTEESFRKELYYRLKVIHLSLPPLRDRREDIPALANLFLRRHSSRAGLPVPPLTSVAMEALYQHAWKGNLRELSNVLERALILAGEDPIDLEQFPKELGEGLVGLFDHREMVEGFNRA